MHLSAMPGAAIMDTATAFLEAHGTKQTPHGTRMGDLAHGSFDDHLRGTCDVLERWCVVLCRSPLYVPDSDTWYSSRHYPEEVCLAGLFHSIYGTEGFQGLILGLEQRAEVAEIIGERAERCVFFNCIMDRDSLDDMVADHEARGLGPADAPHRPLRSRLDERQKMTGTEQFELNAEAFADLMAVHLSDYCEGFVNNHSHTGTRYLRHAKGGVPGFFVLPPGGMFAYRHGSYSAMARLLGGAGLAEWTTLNESVDKTGDAAYWLPGPTPQQGTSPADLDLSASSAVLTPAVAAGSSKL